MIHAPRTAPLHAGSKSAAAALRHGKPPPDFTLLYCPPPLGSTPTGQARATGGGGPWNSVFDFPSRGLLRSAIVPRRSRSRRGVRTRRRPARPGPSVRMPGGERRRTALPTMATPTSAPIAPEARTPGPFRLKDIVGCIPKVELNPGLQPVCQMRAVGEFGGRALARAGK